MKDMFTRFLAVLMALALCLPALGIAEERLDDDFDAEDVIVAERVDEAIPEVVAYDLTDADETPADVSEAADVIADEDAAEVSAEALSDESGEALPAAEAAEPQDEIAEEAADETDGDAAEAPAEVEETVEEALADVPAEPAEALPAEESPAEAAVELTEDAGEMPVEDAAMPEPLADDVVIIEEPADASAKLSEASVNGVAAVDGILPVWHKAVVAMNVGDAVQLVVDGQTIKSCKSGKKKVASVTKAGWLTAKKAGKAKLTIRLKGQKKPIKVTVQVVDPWKATAVYLDRTGTVTIGKGQTLQLNAAMTTLSGEPSTSTLKWKSSKRKVATVNKYGLVTGRKKGKTKITVKTSSGKKASVVIKVVNAAQVIEPSPAAGDGSGVTSGATTGTTGTTGTGAGGATETVFTEVRYRFRDDLAKEVIDIVNKERAAAGRKDMLEIDDELMEAANIRAKELEQLFSHTRPDGTVCFTVSDKVNGENIARTYKPSAEEVMKVWMSSEGHRENILHVGYTGIGVACYEIEGEFISGANGQKGLYTFCYWVQLFEAGNPYTQDDGVKIYLGGKKELPDGTIVYLDGTKVYTDGTIAYPDGMIVKPDVSVECAGGTILYADGSITKGEGYREELTYGGLTYVLEGSKYIFYIQPNGVVYYYQNNMLCGPVFTIPNYVPKILGE